MKKIKNIAIIAHVDHGKTSLVDKLLKMSGTFRENEEVAERVMDSNDIERERGITILAKTTAINYKDTRINILDTPGHADFGGEVERIMNMVDGVLLVVDAYEGTMPQTRFVLKKALEAGVTPIVVVNKIDKPTARPKEVVDEVLDLFIELGADLDQLDFPVVYCSAINGTCSLDPEISTQKETMDPIFDLILEHIPSPSVGEGSLQFQPALLDYNDFVGRIGIGLVKRGKVEVNQMVSCVRLDGSIKQFRIQKMFGFIGLKRVEITNAEAGDIIAIAGLPDIEVGETVCEIGKEDALPKLRIDEPTLQMTFATNSSPFAGREGKILTASKIQERLFKETERDVSLKVEKGEGNESWIVSGRGELHLSILIENMRREGFELQVSKPQVIKKEIDGVKCEPFEELQIDLPDEYVGGVIEALGRREANMEHMSNSNGQTRILYTIPSRGLIGFSTDFMTLTKGYGMMSHTYKEYRPLAGETVGERKLGVLVSMENGSATTYSLGQLEDRGVMFIEPGAEVYEGMIVGEHSHDNDIVVNVIKGKNLTNTRTSSKDHTVVLKRPKVFTLEGALDYINSDELVEVTPVAFRLRKKYLTEQERKRNH
ncbi:MAG TPA: translational GTPase TypA [Bacilli bacterium]|nr:translational GTPase TypA [Bacilli bacterium]